MPCARPGTARTKYGYYLNFEQALTDDRSGYSLAGAGTTARPKSPRSPTSTASLSFGTSIRGKAWGRPDDKIGLAVAINGLSRDHRDYIAVGGLGILIGDGMLNYRPEKILETFYAWYILKGRH